MPCRFARWFAIPFPSVQDSVNTEFHPPAPTMPQSTVRTASVAGRVGFHFDLVTPPGAAWLSVCKQT